MEEQHGFRHLQPRTAREDGAALITARRKKGTDIQNSFALGPSASSSRPVKLEGVGPKNVVTSSVTCCKFEPGEFPLRSARLAGPAGSAGGRHREAKCCRFHPARQCVAQPQPSMAGRAKCSGWLALRS